MTGQKTKIADRAPRRNDPWPAEQDEHLLRLWAAGRSAGQCFPLMNAKFGGSKTRQSIIGRIARLRKKLGAGVVRSVSPHQVDHTHTIGVTKRLTEKQKKLLGRPVEPARVPKSKTKIIDGNNLEPPKEAFKDLPDVADEQAVDINGLLAVSCLWPIGDPKSPEFLYCGHQKLEGLPYCEGHAARAFVPQKGKIVSRRPVGVDTYLTTQRKLA